ncbi:MAG: hypothetical protein ACI4NG_03395 [Candidatus Gallimonas sp.]
MKGKLLSLMMITAFVAGTGVGFTTVARAEEGRDEATEITTENAELFLPSEYEQYLPLEAPKDVAFCDGYVAIADGTSLYLYDRSERVYRRYTHTATIAKIQFTEDGTLYFLDEKTFLYILSDLNTASVAVQQAFPASNFLIEGDALYYATVSNYDTKITRFSLSDSTSVDVEKARPIGVPHLAYADGALLCAGSSTYYSYTFDENGSVQINNRFLTDRPSEADNLTALCAYRGALYYTTSGTGGGLYRSDGNGNAVRLLEGNFSALTQYEGNLYCVKDDSVLGVTISATGAVYNGYEICGGSSSETRLSDASRIARAGDLTVVADEGNARVSVYDRSADRFSVIDCAYAQMLVATDGDYIAVADRDTARLSVYRKDGDKTFETKLTERSLAGVACSYGTVYYVTTANDYGSVSADGTVKREKYRNVSSFVPKALTCDVFNTLYVAGEDGSVIGYSADTFVSAEEGERLSVTLPVEFRSLKADYNGNLYCLKGNSVYRNGTLFATVNVAGSVYRTDSFPEPKDFALGFEDDKIELLYDNFILRTDALTFSALDAIGTENATDEIFSPEQPLALVTVEDNAIGVTTDLSALKESGEYFPYVRYFRTQTAMRGILLAQTSEYHVVALVGSDHRYTVNLFRRERNFVAEIGRENYWTETDGERFLTNGTALYLFPCLSEDLHSEELTRGDRVDLLATVAAANENECTFAYVRNRTTGTCGYLPISYLTAVPPIESGTQFRFTELAEQEEGVVFRAENGDEVRLFERTRIEITENGETYLARFEQDGTSYYAEITADMLARQNPDALRISLIVVLCVLAVVIAGGYLYLKPRKSDQKRSAAR